MGGRGASAKRVWTAGFVALTAGLALAFSRARGERHGNRGPASRALEESRGAVLRRGHLGEREAACAAAERLKAKLEEAIRCGSAGRAQVHHAGSMVGQVVHRALPPLWVQTVPLCAPAPHDGDGQRAAQLFNEVVWRQFCELHDDLWAYLDQTTERVIARRSTATQPTRRPPPNPLGLDKRAARRDVFGG